MVSEKIFEVFSIIQSIEHLDPRVGPVWTPGGLIGRTNVEYHYTLLHTKYISYEPHGFK